MSWELRKRTIRALAEQILRKAEIDSAPVDVEKIAGHLKAEIRRAPYSDDISGMLAHDDGRVIVGVNSTQSRMRQRFTIAHELGHYLLHAGHTRHVDRRFPAFFRDGLSSQAVDGAEIEANTLAAELLMPAYMLERDISEETIDFMDDNFTKKLATKYDVSLQAMTFRLANLGFMEH